MKDPKHEVKAHQLTSYHVLSQFMIYLEMFEFTKMYFLQQIITKIALNLSNKNYRDFIGNLSHNYTFQLALPLHWLRQNCTPYKQF